MVDTQLPHIPRHVAIIMDGNGRWASARGLPRTAGHKQGIVALRRTVRAACDRGIDVLTIYAFSSENWSRPKTEVSFLMDMFRRFVRQDVAELHSVGVKICMIGDRESLDEPTLRLIEDAEKLTVDNKSLTLVIAFNYGGRQEIVRAARAMLASGISPEKIQTESFAGFLDTAKWPDPELLIRTGGEERISNFLLWQSAYTEFVFMQEYWPDFDAALLDKAIAEFQSRERRFGGLKAQTA
jgi:undecaprenyl diphosphate synthase